MTTHVSRARSAVWAKRTSKMRRSGLTTACTTTRNRPVISTTDNNDVVMDEMSAPYIFEMRCSSATDLYTKLPKVCGSVAAWGFLISYAGMKRGVSKHARTRSRQRTSATSTGTCASPFSIRTSNMRFKMTAMLYGVA